MNALEYLVGRLKRGLIAFIGMVTLAHRDWPYHDFHSDTTTAVYQTYVVGNNNRLRRGDQFKLFTSKSLLIMSTTNTYVKFNHADNVVITLLANRWYEFMSNIYAVHYVYVTEAGTIYIYPEGVPPQEARRPE